MVARALLAALTGDEEIETLLGDDALLGHALAFERALAEAQAEAGLVTTDSAAAIVACIDGFAPDMAGLAAGMKRDGVVIPALVQALRHKLAPEHADALHRGATSQDALDTATSLQLRDVLGVIEARLARFIATLDAVEIAQGETRLMAHTRMQRALPSTLSARIEGWAAPLRRHHEAIGSELVRGLPLQLAGPVGDGQSFAGRRDRIAAAVSGALGLRPAASWQTARDGVARIGAEVSLLTNSLGKIGLDLGFMAQNEIATVSLADGGGSSSMPHKANPVGPEVMVALARYASQLQGGLQHAMLHEQERSGAAWTLEWLCLPPLLVACGASLRVAAETFAGIRFSADTGPP